MCLYGGVIFFFKQKTAYEMRISDWSSDVCSSDLQTLLDVPAPPVLAQLLDDWEDQRKPARVLLVMDVSGSMGDVADPATGATKLDLAKSATITALGDFNDDDEVGLWIRSEEHTSELQSLMRISYAVFCLKTQNT